MQASLFNTTLFHSNSSNNPTPAQPPLIPEQNLSQVDLDKQVLDAPNFLGGGSGLRVINTAYDYSHTFNKMLGFPPKNKRKQYHLHPEGEERFEHASRCISLEDSQNQVSIF
jgi:hypothetical protein